MNRTLEQQRAAFALGFITDQERKPDKDKLLTHVQKLPVRILQNGFGQTLAFLLSESKQPDDKTPAGRLYLLLQTWLCGSRGTSRPCRMYATDGNLIGQLVEGDRATYLHAQEEVLLLGSWLKRFGEAFLASK